MALDLSGRTAVVTGSSKGIGYSIAEALARANASVVVSARRSAEVTQAVERLDALGGGKVFGVPGDVSKLVATGWSGIPERPRAQADVRRAGRKLT